MGGGADGGWRLAGVTSDGTTTVCGGSDRLTMFTSIPYSIAWIRTTMASTSAALEIEKRAPEVIEPGATFTYAIEVRNVGRAPATEIKITEWVPSIVTFLSADQGGQLEGDLVQWTVARVAAGESATLHFTVRHVPAGPLGGPFGERTAGPLGNPSRERIAEPRAVAGNRASGKGAGIDIVGGRLAEPGAWPWQAALLSRAIADPSQAQFCGGTLVAADWVLTAAHCVLSAGGTEPANTLDVQLGSNLLSDVRAERIPVAAVVANPQFVSNRDVDIALLKLARPATLSPTVQPVALAQPADAPLFAAGMQGTVAGWGSRFDPGEQRIGLFEVEIPFVDLATCESRGDPDLTLCAGVPEGGKGPCYGDSGGPMVVRHPDGRVLQAGIVSRGTAGRCDGPGSYSLFAKVSAHAEWIGAQLAASEPEETIFNTLLNVYAAGSAGAGFAGPARGHPVFTIVRRGGSAHTPTATPTTTPTPTATPTPDRPATATGTPERPEPTPTAGDAWGVYLPVLRRQVE